MSSLIVPTAVSRSISGFGRSLVGGDPCLVSDQIVLLGLNVDTHQACKVQTQDQLLICPHYVGISIAGTQVFGDLQLHERPQVRPRGTRERRLRPPEQLLGTY